MPGYSSAQAKTKTASVIVWGHFHNVGNRIKTGLFFYTLWLRVCNTVFVLVHGNSASAARFITLFYSIKVKKCKWMYFAQQLVKMSKWFGAFKLKCVTQSLLRYCTWLLGFDQLRPASFNYFPGVQPDGKDMTFSPSVLSNWHTVWINHQMPIDTHK